MRNIGTAQEAWVPGTQPSPAASLTPVLPTPPASAPAVLTPTGLTPARLRRVILVLSVACGMAVANIYYSQPLLGRISAAFGISQGRTELVVTLTQLGYAIGLFLLVPLGDLLENRALVSRTLLVTAAALLAAGLAPNFGVFLIASVVVGISSMVAQILVPFAAHLASPADRGKVVGNVMAGLLLGILLARTVASLVAAAWGWRIIFLASAVLMLVLSVLLTRMLPKRMPEMTGSYPQLMLSTLRLIREEPVLRRRAACQALLFGAFSCFWTSVAFELIARHHLGQVGIGIFALVGAAGATAAPLAGRLGDRGHGHVGSGIALALAVVAMILAGLGAGNLILLALAGVLLDFAVQSHQVFGQREIYELRGDARARVNTIYMTSIFLGGTLATAISGAIYDSAGWIGVTRLGAGLAFIALGIWAVSALRRRGASALA
jgi:predicted MFS family arabinose efflux permease